MKSWLNRRGVFVFAEGAHAWASRRLREKIFSSKEQIEAEAERLVEIEYRDVPKGTLEPEGYDGPTLEEEMSSVTSDYEQMITEFESHAVGLYIAAIYHQWERETKQEVAGQIRTVR